MPRAFALIFTVISLPAGNSISLVPLSIETSIKGLSPILAAVVVSATFSTLIVIFSASLSTNLDIVVESSVTLPSLVSNSNEFTVELSLIAVFNFDRSSFEIWIGSVVPSVLTSALIVILFELVFTNSVAISSVMVTFATGLLESVVSSVTTLVLDHWAYTVLLPFTLVVSVKAFPLPSLAVFHPRKAYPLSFSLGVGKMLMQLFASTLIKSGVTLAPSLLTSKVTV